MVQFSEAPLRTLPKTEGSQTSLKSTRLKCNTCTCTRCRTCTNTRTCSTNFRWKATGEAFLRSVFMQKALIQAVSVKKPILEENKKIDFKEFIIFSCNEIKSFQSRVRVYHSIVLLIGLFSDYRYYLFTLFSVLALLHLLAFLLAPVVL